MFKVGQISFMHHSTGGIFPRKMTYLQYRFARINWKYEEEKYVLISNFRKATFAEFKSYFRFSKPFPEFLKRVSIFRTVLLLSEPT